MTIASMTGFARAGGSAAGYEWNIEAKSVNGRGLDLRFKIASPFDSLEPEMRSAMQRRLQRGNVQIFVSARQAGEAQTPQINEHVFRAYAEAAEKLAWSAKLADANMGDILRLPGVVELQNDKATLPDEAKSAFLVSFETLLTSLVDSRRSEGSALGSIVNGIVDSMATLIEAAAEAEAARTPALKARLKAQVDLLLESNTSFDPDRLHQEAILLVARQDVREELDRLRAHIAHAREQLVGAGPVGRRLDFLSQELVREANTLCSKSNDIALTRIGLDLKTAVEQFREQVQNIE